jgi:hypothetical protein
MVNFPLLYGLIDTQQSGPKRDGRVAFQTFSGPLLPDFRHKAGSFHGRTEVMNFDNLMYLSENTIRFT